MGRYYSGDIEGKFWFGVQSSQDGEFFGAEAQEPSHINYYTEDLKKAQTSLKLCLRELGENKEKLDKFFEEHNYYNDKDLSEYMGMTEDEVKSVLEWYARLHLGEKIAKCIEEHGSCQFEAEL